MQALGQFFAPIVGIFNFFFYKPVYNVLMVLYQAFHAFLPGFLASGAFGLAIIVLTLILRGCLIPLTRKQLKSSRAMQELQPRLKELKAQYKNNPQEMMAAQQALYKEHGVNPVSGCLPLVIQMPFIYALYGAFETVIYAKGDAVAKLAKVNGDLYPFTPHLHAMPNTFFLWTNLATLDPTHILPILAAIFTFLQLRMALPVRQRAAAGQKDSMTQATGMMQYVMPIMTLVIGLNFAAGLCLYWCVSTMFSAIQQYFLTGVGSLFVGIPGLEHLVPEPKVVAAPTPAKAISTGSARALTAPTVTSEPATGGLRGMLRQMKEQMSAAQQNVLDAQKAKQNGSAPANGASAQNAAKTATASTVDAGESFAVAPKPTAPRRDRQRSQQKAGPILVKPPSNGASPAKRATDATSDSGELPEVAPEVAIARDASGPPPFEDEPLPEKKIASLAASGNGNGNGNGKSGKNGNSAGAVYKPTSGKNGNVPAASGARSTSSTNNRSGGQRKPSSNNGNKGSQSPRPRPSGRAKGGR